MTWGRALKKAPRNYSLKADFAAWHQLAADGAHRVATILWGVSYPDAKRHQGQAGHLGGAQEWPREGLTRTKLNLRQVNVQSAQPAQAAGEAETNQNTHLRFFLVC